MKKLTKVVALVLCLTLAVGLFACGKKDSDDGTEYGLEIDDISLLVGTNQVISYKITPVGTSGIVSYSVTATPQNSVRISGGTVYADAAGTATVTATAVNLPSAAETFEATATFTVTVTEPVLEEGNLILNGGFENGFYGWELVPENPQSTYKYTVNTDDGDTLHSGVHALNLWSKIGATSGESDALNLVVKQSITAEKGSYLFSLWYKGKTKSITMSVIQSETVIATGEFNGESYGLLIVEGQNDYVQYGIDVAIPSSGEYTVVMRFFADYENNYGFVDDIAFEAGKSIEDLARPEIKEQQHNFFTNGSFTTDTNGWTISGTTLTRKTEKGLPSITYWGTSLEFSQIITGLPDLSDYTLSFKVITSDAKDYKTPTECYFYFTDESGATEYYKENITINVGYNWVSVTLDNLELSGTVKFGVVLTYSVNGWAGFTDFVLSSANAAVS